MAKKATGFVVFILFFSSIFFWPSLMDKYLVSRYLLQSLILLVGGYFFYEQFSKQKSASLNLIDVAFLVYYLIHLISITWAYDLGEAVFTTQKILIGFCIYYFMRLLMEKSKLPILERIVQSSFGLTAVLLLYVPFEMLSLTESESFSNQALYNVSGFMGNKSLLSEFLFLLLPFNLIGFIKAKQKMWYTLLLFAQVLLILFLQVRVVYLVFLLCGTLYIFWLATDLPKFRKIFLTRLLPIGAGATLLLFAIIRFSGAFPDLGKRLNITTWLESGTAAERLFIWHKTTSLIAENWLFGLGSGSWKIYFPSNSIQGGWRFETLDTFATRVHNDYLEVFAETGFFGILSFLAIFGFAFYAGIKTLRTKSFKQKEFLVLTLIGLFGFSIISFIDFPKERLEHQAVFAILLALTAHWGKDYLKIGKPKLPGNWFPWFFGSLMFLLATNLHSGAMRFIGEVHVRKALTAKVNQNWPLAIAEAQKSFSKLYTMDPTTVPVPWIEGIGYFNQNDISNAFTCFEKALKVNPYNYHVLNNYGTTLAKMERYQQAIPYFEEALRINPSFDDCKFNLAFSLYQLKDYENALRWTSKTAQSEKRDLFINTINQAINGQ
ncbi:MAG: tetratricopeptide repeat protein [Bacteroidota bacterium]